MLTARLESPLGDQLRPVGPSPYFIAEGETLKTADGSHVAVHRGGLWQIGNDAYISVSFETPVMVRFEDPAAHGHAEFGPFRRTRIVNGSIWVQKEDSVQLLAHFSDINWLWTIFPIPTLKASILKVEPIQESR